MDHPVDKTDKTQCFLACLFVRYNIQNMRPRRFLILSQPIMPNTCCGGILFLNIWIIQIPLPEVPYLYQMLWWRYLNSYKYQYRYWKNYWYCYQHKKLSAIGGGGHTGLWCDCSPCRGLCHCLMQDYASRCRTSTMIMVTINFWWNSDPVKKKRTFF